MQARQQSEGVGVDTREASDIVQNMGGFTWADNQHFSTPVKQMEGGTFTYSKQGQCTEKISQATC